MRNITSLDGSCYEAIDSSVYHKIFFRISKCLACNAEKALQLKITKKRTNIANFINIFIYIYIPILYVTRITRNKNDSINSIPQHGRVVEIVLLKIFPTPRYPYLILCSR